VSFPLVSSRLPVILQRSVVPLLLATLGLLLVWVPGIPSFCPMRLALHVPCPSCGLTRSARLALAGDWGGATRMHPLWLVVLPYVGLVGAAECVGYLGDGRWGRWAGRPAVKRLGCAIAMALVAVWIAREMGALGGPVAIAAEHVSKR
jgi:hypothetical protein